MAGDLSSNSTGPTDDEKLAALREYGRQRRSCDEANGVLRALVKRLKASGINVPAMLATAKALRRDPDDVAVEMRETLTFMALRRIPVGKYDLFPEGSSEPAPSDHARTEEDMWAAEDKGYRAGRSGVPFDDNPYLPGGEDHVIWGRFWHNGQTAIAAELGENARQASAKRDRPARKSDAAGDETTVAAVEQNTRAAPRKAAGPKSPRKAAAARKASNGAAAVRTRRRPAGEEGHSDAA